jgi:hypothetical protein
MESERGVYNWTLTDAVVSDARARGLNIYIVTQCSYQDTGDAVLRRLGGPVAPWNWPTVRDVMRWTGREGKALWLTETGWNTADIAEEAQAAFYEQVLDGVDAYEWLDKVFFYQLVDEPDSPDRWGILRVDLSPKPAYDAYQHHIASQTSTAAQRGRAVDPRMRHE